MASIRDETPRVKTLVLDAEGWDDHRAGQHLDVRLTAEDGYQAQRSYSIASVSVRVSVENGWRRRVSEKRLTSVGVFASR